MLPLWQGSAAGAAAEGTSRRRWWDLRFERTEDEDAFRTSLQADLLRSTWKSCALISVLLLSIFADLGIDFKRNPRPFHLEAADPRTAVLLETTLAFVWNISVGVAAFLRHRRGSFRSVDWELLNVGTWTANTLVMIFGNKGALSQYYGIAMEDAFVQAPGKTINDFSMLLFVLVAVSVLCTFVPVRLHRVWVLPATSMLATIVSVVSWNFMAASYLPIGLASMIVAVFFMSSKQKEAGKREAWQLIQGLKLQEQELQSRQASTLRLLSSFCDCVFTVSHDLRLVDPSKSLASFLLRGQSVPEGFEICNLLKQDQDKERFREFVLQSGSDELEDSQSSLPSSLTLDFSDSMGRSVCAHVYLASMRTSEGTQHIVGIAEATERGHLESACPTSAGSASAVAFGKYVSISEYDRRSKCSRESAGDQLFVGMETYEDESLCSLDIGAQDKPKSEPLCVSICMSTDMEIVRRNDAFVAAFGGDGNGSFGAHLEDAESFRQWLGQLQSEIVAGSIEPPALREFGIVSVMKKGANDPEHMWLAVTLPASTGGTLKEDALRGSYHINIRLTEPTSNRALHALAGEKRSKAKCNGKTTPLHAVVPALPGSL